MVLTQTTVAVHVHSRYEQSRTLLCQVEIEIVVLAYSQSTDLLAKLPGLLSKDVSTVLVHMKELLLLLISVLCLHNPRFSTLSDLYHVIRIADALQFVTSPRDLRLTGGAQQRHLARDVGSQHW